ncbi:unnamed protein product [Adineta ricciae]|uniref:Uncharacterized protein n=1 Tax=Adineta ricciae TaxID=249248 RepID=A0A816BZD2_ADIRI|nr:unnamed protein product [Adineta ricciae]
MGSKFQIDDISNDKVDPEIKRVTLTARDFHLTLVDNKQHQNDSNLVAVYNCFGIIYFRLGFYDEALDVQISGVTRIFRPMGKLCLG